MHACIAAFSANIPVLLLGYSRKFSGLFRDTLNYPYLLDVTDGFSEESVLRAIREMLNCLPEITNSIRNKNEEIVTPRIGVLCQVLKDILNG
jgi:polysaccharide pyruvyl transferase WcaK-like protein